MIKVTSALSYVRYVWSTFLRVSIFLNRKYGYFAFINHRKHWILRNFWGNSFCKYLRVEETFQLFLAIEKDADTRLSS